MKKNKKVSLSKKPFLVLSRRAIAGWLSVIFILCAWMFVIGVLVGRGTAPVKFDMDGLQSKLEKSRQDLKKQQTAPTRGESGMVEDKTKLDFYEALPENREDTKIDPKKSSQIISPKVAPPADKKPSPTTGSVGVKKSPPEKQTGEKAATAKKEPVKPPAEKQTASKSATQSFGNVYTVQVAAVKVAKDADRLVAQLKKKGYPAYRTISKVQDTGIWFRVRVGEYKSRAAAQQTKRKLEKEGKKPIIVQAEP